jgi:hypothetical protein
MFQTKTKHSKRAVNHSANHLKGLIESNCEESLKKFRQSLFDSMLYALVNNNDALVELSN